MEYWPTEPFIPDAKGIERAQYTCRAHRFGESSHKYAGLKMVANTRKREFDFEAAGLPDSDWKTPTLPCFIIPTRSKPIIKVFKMRSHVHRSTS